MINLVDNEEMSLQGSINAPMATLTTSSPSQVVMMQPVEISSRLCLSPCAQLVQASAPTMQSSVYARLSGVTVIVQVASGGEPSTIVTMIVVNAPLW